MLMAMNIQNRTAAIIRWAIAYFHHLAHAQYPYQQFAIWAAKCSYQRFQRMKPVFLTVIVLLLVTSLTALPRKFAADDGQLNGDSQAKMDVDIDGKPSSGYGEHVCPRDMYPNCSQRMKKPISSNHLG
uniref:Uncharacterized protein n=1 Tax=Oryza brachyantha TaxID=4533 RepID=J3LVV4_ORYBR